MARAAKSVEIDISPRVVNGIVRDVFDGFEQIESARGKYMSAARKHREAIGLVYERGAARGIPQKVMKLQVRIEQMQNKLIGLVTELESENRKLLQKIAKARGNKAQLALFADLPAMPKPTKAELKAEAAEEETAKGKGATGDDLTAAMEAAGSA